MIVVLRTELGRQQSRVGKELRLMEEAMPDKPHKEMNEDERFAFKQLRQKRESFTRLETAAIYLGGIQLGDIEDKDLA